MRPDEFQFLLTGASLFCAFGLLRIVSVWMQRERYWRILFWLAATVALGAVLWVRYPEIQSLKITDIADAFIAIGGWLLPP